MSDTPETCEAVERWQQGKINIFDEMARLERERDEAREAFVVATNQAIEAREMLRRIIDWSPCLPDYERDEQHFKFQADTFAARKFLEGEK